MTKRYIISCAVNDTRVHPGFFASMKQYAKHNGAELLIVAAKYKNPTAKRGSAKKLRDETYAAQVVPYLTNDEIKLGPQLTLFANLPIQPTASNPTSGLEVFCKSSSAIVGHVKRAMQVVPTEHLTPRVLWSTSACTVAKYSRSRAGLKAKKHHVIGAVVVEVKRNGKFFIRNVTANSDGSFSDLDTFYTPTGAVENDNALSVTAGDIHVGQDDERSLRALEQLVGLMQPDHLVVHDVLDFDARSHHRRSPQERYERRFHTVDAELDANAAFYQRVLRWAVQRDVVVVESNHHEHLMRWLREFDVENDVGNAPTYHRMWSDLYTEFDRTGEWANPYERAMRQRGVGARVRFLKRSDSFKLASVEGGFHGDDGVSGSRGSILAYTKLGCKVTIGHSHTPGIRDGVFQTGVTGSLDMGYNRRPTTWLHAHVVLHRDGKRQMVVVVEG
ncbi:MAG: hypothetical protein RLZZ450_115 [Pseudomonadota bacterium]